MRRWLGFVCVALGCGSTSETQKPRIDDASLPVDVGSFDEGVSVDVAPGADAIFPTDDAAELPKLPDFSLGPYPSALEILLRALRANAKSLDTSKTYSHSAGQGYLLQAIGVLLRTARTRALPGGEATRDELVALAITEIDELIAASTKVRGGVSGFGLDEAWDAFGDGSTNPAYTCYAWQTGQVALGVGEVLRYLDEAGARHADRDGDRTRIRGFLQKLVAPWATHWTSVTEAGASLGYYWYSLETADAKAVHNTSALISMAVQILGESSGPIDPKPERYAGLLKRRFQSTTAGYAWSYVDDGYPTSMRRPEDVSHALLTLQFIRFARARDWYGDVEMGKVASTILSQIWSGHPGRLHGYVDGSSAGANEWAWSAAATVGLAAHADAPGGRPEIWDYTRSLLVSSYFTANDLPRTTATADAVRALAIALLFRHRPSPFSADSKWSREAGAGDDALPAAPGNVRFYTVDWAAPTPTAAESMTLVARRATAPNANLLVDLEDGDSRKVVVSITYRADTDGSIGQWDGSKYIPLTTLPASKREDGKVVWMRTSFVLNANRFDYEKGVPGTNILLQLTQLASVARIEATPL